MSIQFDATYHQATAGALSWNHTVGVGNDKILLVMCGTHIDTTVTGVTFNGVSLTKLGEVSGNYRRAQIWYLLNPPEGTYAVQLTKSGSTYNVSAGSISFLGVSQTSPFRDHQGEYGAASTVDITVTSLSTDIVVDILTELYQTSCSQGAGQTLHWYDTSSNIRTASSRKNGGDPSTTMSWTGGATDNYAYYAASLIAELSSVAELQLPSLTITAGQNGLDKTLPSLTINAGINGAILEIPTLYIIESWVDVPFKDVIVSLPRLVGDGEAKIGTKSTASIILPSLITLSIGGEPYDSTGDMELPLFTIDATTITGEVYNADIKLPFFLINSIHKTGTISKGAINLPIFEIVGKPVNHGYLDVDIPIFGINAYAHGPLISILSETLPMFEISAYLQRKQDGFRIYVVNIDNEALTEYKNFDFNSFCTFKDKHLGANASGIMILEGSDDNGTSIDASLGMGITDFRIPNIKKVHDAYISAKGDGGLILMVTTDDGLESGYPVTLESARTRPAKINIGKGKKGKYWEFALDNVGGSDFELYEIELNVELLDRRM